MKYFYLIIPVLTAILFSACESNYMPSSIGNIDEIIVVMDSTEWDSETALAIEETFGKVIETIPGAPEPKYNLTYRDFRSNEELENLRSYKNVIFATPIDAETNVGTFVRALFSDDVEQRIMSGESFAFPLENRWVRDQWVLILASRDDVELAEKIRNSEESIVTHLEEREFDRREYEVYRRGEQVELNDMLWENYGWKVRMQHDYIQVTDTTDAVVFGRYLPENNRRMWAWWQDNVTDIEFLDEDWINATRDSLMQIYMQGERDGSYVATNYNRPMNTREIERDDRLIAFESQGIWEMVGNFMGGPYVNFTYYDPETERLFMVEYWQFAPNVNKRRFVRQFQAMGRTFESDSTWNERNNQALTNAMGERD